MIKNLYRIGITIVLVLLASTVVSSAQNRIMVAGKVFSEASSESLPGADVIIKGTTVGTMTDFDGQFVIEAAPGDVLQVMLLGMQTREITVNAKMSGEPLEIYLKDDTLFLEDVVVVGYGTQRKQSVVGAISQVKADELEKTGGVTNISNALSGLVPGLTTLNYSGKPGQDSADIIIRSKSTWNGSSPLILVDGIERNMNDLDVSEVESISVLKDASATAVFGVRGGNGVILVTTKRGKEGKPVMTATANVIAKRISKMPEHLNSYEALWLRNIAVENELAQLPTSWNYITPVSILQKYRDHSDPYLFPDVNWTDEIIKQYAFSQRYNWDIRGGTKFVRYYGSLSYVYDGDVMKGQDLDQSYVPKNDYSRYNYRANLDFTVTPTTTFSVDLDGAIGVEQTTNASITYLLKGIYSLGPDMFPVKYEDGYFADKNVGSASLNPVEILNYSGVKKETRMDVNVTFSLDQKLDFVTKGLRFKGIVNFRNYYYSTGADISGVHPITKFVDWRSGATQWNIPDFKHGFDFDMDENQVTVESPKTNVYKNLMYQMTLNYNRTFGKHGFTGLAMFKRIETATGANFPTFREEWAGRVTYDYDGRYLLEFNGAYNGSEKFAKGNKFGFFPSAAAGWVITQEPFFRKTDLRNWVDLIKLRYSWGKVGSDNNIPKWLYVTQWSTIANSAVLGTPDAKRPPFQGYEVSTIGNEDARWETAIKNDIALETAFFNNKLSVVYDYFWGRRYDIFMNADRRVIPPWFGADPVAANIGKTREHGWEFEARWHQTLKCGLGYNLGAMFSYAKGIIDYMEDPEFEPAYQKSAGHQIGQQKTTLTDGLIKTWDEMYTSVTADQYQHALPGMFRYVDYNGDGIVDKDDVVPYGYPNRPQYNMNFSAGLSYKNISVSVQLLGTRNCTLYQSPNDFYAPDYYSSVDRDVFNDMWMPGEKSDAKYRVPVYMLAGDAVGSGDYYYKDGTMWRLKNAEIAYNIHGKKLEKVGISNINVYINGNNLYLWSHLNEDRETGSKRGHGSISEIYPLTKRYNFGLRVKF